MRGVCSGGIPAWEQVQFIRLVPKHTWGMAGWEVLEVGTGLVASLFSELSRWDSLHEEVSTVFNQGGTKVRERFQKAVPGMAA